MRSRLVLWGSRSGDVQAGSPADRVVTFVAGLSRAEIEAGLVLAPRQKELLSRFFDLDATGRVTYKPVRVGEQ